MLTTRRAFSGMSNRGLTFAKTAGKRPSRDMANMLRDPAARASAVEMNAMTVLKQLRKIPAPTLPVELM